MTTERRVVCAAIRNARGQIIVGPRHFDATMHAAMDTHEYLAQHTTGDGPTIADEWHRAEQGFIDQHGEFLTREEAWKVAVHAGQIIRRVGGDGARLYSENLY